MPQAGFTVARGLIQFLHANAGAVYRCSLGNSPLTDYSCRLWINKVTNINIFIFKLRLVSDKYWSFNPVLNQPLCTILEWSAVCCLSMYHFFLCFFLSFFVTCPFLFIWNPNPTATFVTMKEIKNVLYSFFITWTSVKSQHIYHWHSDRITYINSSCLLNFIGTEIDDVHMNTRTILPITLLHYIITHRQTLLSTEYIITTPAKYHLPLFHLYIPNFQQ